MVPTVERAFACARARRHRWSLAALAALVVVVAAPAAPSRPTGRRRRRRSRASSRRRRAATRSSSRPAATGRSPAASKAGHRDARRRRPGATATMAVRASTGRATSARRARRSRGSTSRARRTTSRSRTRASRAWRWCAPTQMVGADILFDNNTHAGINVCGSCYEGRLQVAGYEAAAPSGVTIRNSTFGPGGDADGIQLGADGVQVLDNEFTGIRQVSAVHTDSLQLYGARNTVIRGNYFHDFDVAIMAPDGGTNEVIADNVFVGGDYRPAVQLGSHVGTQFVHNTVKDMDVHMDRKSENPGSPSRDGVIRDNVFVNGTIGGYSNNTSYCSNCTFSHNLFSSSGAAKGTNAVVGTPVFTGGANPATYARLRARRRLARQGQRVRRHGPRHPRRARRPAPTPTPTPTPAPTPTPTPDAHARPRRRRPRPTPTPSPRRTPPLDTPAQAVWTAPAGVQVGRPVTLDGVGLDGRRRRSPARGRSRTRPARPSGRPPRAARSSKTFADPRHEVRAADRPRRRRRHRREPEVLPGHRRRDADRPRRRPTPPRTRTCPTSRTCRSPSCRRCPGCRCPARPPPPARSPRSASTRPAATASGTPPAIATAARSPARSGSPVGATAAH